jgi:uncharacterized Zn finger protein (UPF0148 family)
MKKNSQKKTNVDFDYNRQVKQFNHDYKQVPSKKKRLKQLQQKYVHLSKKNLSELSKEEIDIRYQTKIEIDELTRDISNIEQLNDVTNFYLKNGELLINYYEDTLVKSRKIVQKSIPITSNSGSRGIAPSIIHFFGKKTDSNHEITKTNSHCRADMYEQYLEYNDPHYVGNIEYNHDDFCSKCGIHRELVQSEAMLICPQCGEEVQTVIEADKPSYNDPPHENIYFAYKRINHFKEQLAHYQAKETTKIPPEIYDMILIECKKEKLNDLAKLNKKKVKKYLRKYIHLGYNKFYENINQIICHLNGIQPISFPPDVEEKFCNMFQKIQEPFEKYCPPGRTNFLSYTYVIYKFCQLAGYNEYLPFFNLLKSKDKLRQQDKIWKKICQDLGWNFNPS